jgi:hypothetical protein
LLTWSTASENNNDHFIIERSENGSDFSQIGRVSSLAFGGSSTSRLDYSFTDHNAPSGTVYYRLKQVDKSGNISQDGINSVNVDFESAGQLTVAPNPSDDYVKIDFVSYSSSPSVIRILDNAGRIVRTEQVNSQMGANTVVLSTSDLGQGFYYVQVFCGEKVYNGKLLRK